MKIVPRPAQKAAIPPALAGLRGRFHRALVVMATGLGKTIAAALIVKQLPAKRVLFLVHNNHILEHGVEDFARVFGANMDFAVYNGMSKNGAEHARFVFATWQTMGGNLKKWKRDHFDLIIVDEAHHTPAKTYKKVVDYFTGAKLGITATPDREDEADIRAIFGPAVIDISIEEAIARGWLPRIEYHVVADESLDEDLLQQIAAEIREHKKRFTMAEVNRRIFIHARDDEIARIISGYDEKAIVFCANIKHAERMHRALPNSAVFHSEVGNGQQQTWDKNKATLAALGDGTIRRVCAVNAFNEGVDVPSVGLVAFCRATNAVTIFRQQLGRGLRERKGKEKLIVLDFVGNMERIQLVRQMMERIADEHERLTTKREREGEHYTRKPFEVSGTGFEFTFSDTVVDLMTILDHCEREFYPTWEEASAAASSCGLKVQREYQKGYKADSRLPSEPWKYYADYPGDTVFFGREKYETWEEASQSAINLGLTSEPEYSRQAGYKRDSKLPSNPDSYYSDFPGWSMFLRKEEPKDLYPTWQEAAEAIASLGIASFTEYQEGYKRDPRLPSSLYMQYKEFPGWSKINCKSRVVKKLYATWQEAGKAAVALGATGARTYSDLYANDPLLSSVPHQVYSDFPGWPKFLGRREKRYETWQEAGKAAVALGITGKVEYRLKYKKDKRLPGSPNTCYPDFPGWPKFLGKKK